MRECWPDHLARPVRCSQAQVNASHWVGVLNAIAQPDAAPQPSSSTLHVMVSLELAPKDDSKDDSLSVSRDLVRDLVPGWVAGWVPCLAPDLTQSKIHLAQSKIRLAQSKIRSVQSIEHRQPPMAYLGVVNSRPSVDARRQKNPNAAAVTMARQPTPQGSPENAPSQPLTRHFGESSSTLARLPYPSSSPLPRRR